MTPKSVSQKLPVLPCILRRGAIAARAEDSLYLHLRRHHRPALGPLIRADNALALQGVDDPTRPGVSDPETPLYGAHRSLLGGDDEARSLRKEFIIGLLGLSGV